MKYVTVHVIKSVVIQGADREIRLIAGKTANIDQEKAQDLQRAGYLEIMADVVAAVSVKATPSNGKVATVEVMPQVIKPDITRKGVTALIVNYNMPERTDALVKYIQAHCGEVEIIVIDNGSDIAKASKHTTLRLAHNVQTTNGWLMGLHYVDSLAVIRGYKPFAYWFIITSAEFTEGDPLTPMVKLLEDDSQAVGVHPALQQSCITAWKDLITRGSDKPRKTWMIDNVASLYRAEWFDSIGRFDPALTFAWGIDLETGYLARKQGRSLWVHEGARVNKTTDIGYTMNRMNMTADDRKQKAEANMEVVLSARYGKAWRDMLWNDYREPDDLISVILPTFNRPTLLPRALESLKDQTYKYFEVIVVNDGGVDVGEIVSRYPFARYIQHDKNRGLSAARNTGIRAANGRYLAYLDDDDWYYSNHLATAIQAIKGRRAVYTEAHAIDREFTGTRYVFGQPFDREKQLSQNLFPCNTVLHERSLIDQVGYFDETLPNSEDWDMWIRIAKVTDWYYVPVVTCAVDRTRPTMSSNRPAMLKTFDLIRERYNGSGKHEITQVKEREYAALDIDRTAWAGNHPFGISGCIRVRNDDEFLRAAVVTHLPYCNEIVLALQSSEDDSEQVCNDLAKQYPDVVRVVKYPVIPVYIFDQAWDTTPETSAYSFIHLSNWALAQCRYSWIAKFEADVVAVSSMRRIVDRIKASPNDRRFYGRVVLNVGGLDYGVINAKVPATGGWDEGVFPNHPDWHFVKAGKYESLDYSQSPHECIGWGGIHLKHAKLRHWGKIKEPFQPFDKEHLAGIMADWLKSHQWPGSDNPLGEPCLFESGWQQYCPAREAAHV